MGALEDDVRAARGVPKAPSMPPRGCRWCGGWAVFSMVALFAGIAAPMVYPYAGMVWWASLLYVMAAVAYLLTLCAGLLVGYFAVLLLFWTKGGREHG